MGRCRKPNSPYHFLPVAHYSPAADEFSFEGEFPQIPNRGVSLLPILYGAHWVGVEVDQQHDTPEITLLQASTPLQLVLKCLFVILSKSHPID